MGCLLAVPAVAEAACGPLRHDGNSYTVCEVDLSTHEAQLYWRDAEGALYGDFATLPDHVLIATNGGMYHEDRRPVGHYLEAGVEIVPPIASAGSGNFGLLPNGVLCLNTGRAAVVETRAYIAARPDCAYATQSGPMLVIDGAMHPRFLPDGTSRKRRGGVGVDPTGTRLFLAVTDGVTNFYDFGLLFRDALGTPNALFTDGTITRVFDRANGRADRGLPMGPILGISPRSPAQGN